MTQVLAVVVLTGLFAFSAGAARSSPTTPEDQSTGGVQPSTNPASGLQPPGVQLPAGDTKALRAIREAIMAPPAGVRDLKLFAKNGKVYITGTVSSQVEKATAGTRAAAAAGELEVVNQLTVK